MVYHGVDFSEALCFGLGCGLGFFYARLDGMPTPRVIGGRTRALETDFFEIIQHPWSWNVEENAEEAWRKVAAWIDRDIPVMLRTDLYYLDYYKSSTHFSGHTILLVGYDEERDGGIAYTSDTHFADVQEVPLARLDLARSSQELPMPLAYHWHQLEAPGELPPKRQMMLHALRRTAEALLDPDPMMPIAIEGVGGIERFAGDLPKWPQELDGDWSWSTRFAYQIIERRGTGGGNFRTMYADFLRECEAEVPELAGFGLSERMERIGRQWTALSDTLKTLSETTEAGDGFLTAGDQAAHLAADEREYCEIVLRKVPEV